MAHSFHSQNLLRFFHICERKELISIKICSNAKFAKLIHQASKFYQLSGEDFDNFLVEIAEKHLEEVNLLVGGQPQFGVVLDNLHHL